MAKALNGDRSRDVRQSGLIDPLIKMSRKLPSNSTFVKKIRLILSIHFSNGFRINSTIELSRFRRFAIVDYSFKIPLSDEDLKESIIACGTLFDGKVYTVVPQTNNKIDKLVNEYFESGAQVIFYTEFYTKNENWLYKANIISKDMLIYILRKLFPNLKFTHTYFGILDTPVSNTLESEILRVWGNDVLMTYDQLAKRLLYIPLQKIKYALSQNSDFIWNSKGTFSHITKIDITEEEYKSIRKVAQKESKVHGYFFITDLLFGEIPERNHELSITAVHNAIFRICLSDKYEKKGKIITRKGDTIDALTIMKNYCRTIEKCSLNDLLNYENELTGEIHRWIPMEAGYAVLVRISKDTFIADKYVHFNPKAIDSAIERFVKGDYLPLKYFTAFGIFPDCGQTWNLFLLESYCRRFSNNFRFDTPSVNSRNAGTIIHKNCTMTYTEIMVDAVAKSGINLSEIIVCKFLFDSGYIGRSTTAKIGEIIDKVKAIRERKN